VSGNKKRCWIQQQPLCLDRHARVHSPRRCWGVRLFPVAARFGGELVYPGRGVLAPDNGHTLILQQLRVPPHRLDHLWDGDDDTTTSAHAYDSVSGSRGICYKRTCDCVSHCRGRFHVKTRGKMDSPCSNTRLRGNILDLNSDLINVENDQHTFL